MAKLSKNARTGRGVKHAAIDPSDKMVKVIKSFKTVKGSCRFKTVFVKAKEVESFLSSNDP